MTIFAFKQGLTVVKIKETKLINDNSRVFQILCSITNVLFPLQVDGCTNYSVLDEAERAQGNVLQPHWRSGKELVTGWYRFQGAAGDHMPDKCVLRFRCGTTHPGWLNGTHPTIADGVVTRTVCFSWSTDCCFWHNIIQVKNCSSHYVYELQRSSWNSLRYCGNVGAGKLTRNEFIMTS